MKKNQARVDLLLSYIKPLEPIISKLSQQGAIAYLVGGTVRDLVIGLPIKDVDIEVHGITLEHLEKVLRNFGPTMLIGKQFGVLRIASLDVDWSMPRKDSKGRKPEVVLDPHMSIEQACRRRDLTMNAMAIDLNDFIQSLILREDAQRFGSKGLSEMVIDPYGGLADIEKKQLRAVDTKLFLEDPLRFFRVMQFIGRFEMQPDEQLNELCARMELHDVVSGASVARERIYEELQKLLLKSRRPSLGFKWLRDIGRLEEIFPELHALIDLPQRPDYHPEGDVFTHTMQSLDASAELDELIELGRADLSESVSALHGCNVEKEKFLLMLATLLHDVGKAVTTNVVSPTEIHTWDHDEKGVPIAQQFLTRITNDRFVRDTVCKLILYHMQPSQFIANKAKPNAYKRLAHKLAPHVSLWHLSMIYWCDLRGRNAERDEPLTWPMQEKDSFLLGPYNKFVMRIKESEVQHAPERPILQGRDLLDVIPPGPQLGKALEFAYSLQIDEGVKHKQELKRRVVQEFLA